MKTETIGVSSLKKMTIKNLKELKEILIVEGFTDEKLAVLIPFDEYVRLSYVPGSENNA